MTPKQKKLLTIIRRSFRNRGIAPTYEEMRGALGLRSKGAVHTMVLRMTKEGILQQHGNKTEARRIEIANVCCPACGAVLARDELDRAA